MSVEMPRLWGGERIEPDELVERAKREHRPVATFCLFSGGNDSGVVAHRMRGQYDALVWIDTGTALPGVREHVERFAGWLGEPLLIYAAPEGSYESLILEKPGFGFPGPAQHSVAYNRLKDRAVEHLIRDHKTYRSRERVLLLTGMRRAESQRRMGFRPPLRRTPGKAEVWANPITDWSDGDMYAYRRDHELPESDVAALIHRSGECNCGCFAQPGERQMLAQLFPEWGRRIDDLERRARERGLPCWRWGERCEPGATPAGKGVGPLCSDCQLTFEEAA